MHSQHVPYTIELAFAIAVRVIDAVVNAPELAKVRIDVHTRHDPDALDHAVGVATLLLAHQFNLGDVCLSSTVWLNTR